MAELAHGTEQDFWRPSLQRAEEDVRVHGPAPSLADACPRCSTEFLLGSKFCHACGGRRPAVLSVAEREDALAMANLWRQAVLRVESALARIPWGKIHLPASMRYLQFHEIKRRLGLPIGSLIAFAVGLLCVAGALLVGLLTAKTLIEWQAIQFYRGEWLLGATASFVAGILLKKPTRD